MTNMPQPPEIFCDLRKQALQRRAITRDPQSFLWDYLAEEISERLRDVSRDFVDILILGPMVSYSERIIGDRVARITLAGAYARTDGKTHYVLAQEDSLPFSPESFDLVISAGTLDSINDLPGALIQIRRCLRPDGLFLGSMFGEGNLSTLKSSLFAAEQERASAHIHPQIDLKNAADLLSRAGFTIPVADKDVLPVRYSSLTKLLCDLRDIGAGNAMKGKRSYFGKNAYKRLMGIWNGLSDSGGKVREQFVFIHLSGWALSDSQPKPARRGSAIVSLAKALKAK
jgi:NADH dehydrogenase [ubiquinone] 1 alpha subcomplex assembly factor 5